MYAHSTQNKVQSGGDYNSQGFFTLPTVLYLAFSARTFHVYYIIKKNVRNSKTRANQHFFKVIFVFTTLKSFGIRFFHLSYIFTVDQCNFKQSLTN